MALEFTEPEELEKFLADKPPQWSHLIAARAALRVLPMALSGLPEKHWMPVLRPCFVSWAASKFPTEITASAVASAAHVAAAAASASASASAARSAANAASSAAHSLTRTGAGTKARFAARSADRSARSVADSIDSLANPAARSAALFAMSAAWMAISTDATYLFERGQEENIAQLAVVPLWPRVSVPRAVADRWLSFVDKQLTSHYAPWINWYQALLTGNGSSADYFGPELTLLIAKQLGQWWNRPASEVNADIAAWLRKRDQAVVDAATADKSDNLEKLFDKTPPQGPGPYRYATRNDRIYVLPPMNVDDPQGLAEDYRTEAQEKAEELLERLNRSNADPQAARAVSRLLETLRPPLSDIRPALLDSRTLSIATIADAFDNPSDERELFAGAIAQLRDLGLTARRLCLCFPELRDIEADAMAFGLQPENVPMVLAATADIANAAKQSPLLEAETVVALDTVQEEAAQPAPEPVRRKRAALAAQNVRNLLIEVISAVRRTGVATGGATWRAAKDTVATARPLLVQGGAYALVVAAAALAGEVLGPMYQLAILAGGFKEIKDVLAAIKNLIKPDDDPT